MGTQELHTQKSQGQRGEEKRRLFGVATFHHNFILVKNIIIRSRTMRMTEARESSDSDGRGSGGVFIFLHGVGGSGEEWERLSSLMPPSATLLAPTADEAPVALFGNQVCRSWFNMYDSYSSNVAELKSSAAMVHSMIEKEVSKGTPASRIVLGGFSQGGALALYA